jgi:hypothetical protein
MKQLKMKNSKSRQELKGTSTGFVPFMLQNIWQEIKIFLSCAEPQTVHELISSRQ